MILKSAIYIVNPYFEMMLLAFSDLLYNQPLRERKDLQTIIIVIISHHNYPPDMLQLKE